MAWRGIFSHREVEPGLFSITEDYYVSGNRANIWLVKGDEKENILIDTGLGVHNVRQYILDNGLVSEDGDILALATHVHFDHSGGLHYFDQVGIHESEVRALENGDQTKTVTWLSCEEISIPPSEDWDASSYKVQAAKVTKILHDQDIIQCSSVRLKVLHLPGHSCDSLVFLEESKGWIFTGDVLYSGGLIDWLPTSCVRKYRDSMQTLINLRLENKYKSVFPGHGPVLDMDQTRAIAQNYLGESGELQNIGSSCMSCVASLALRIKNA